MALAANRRARDGPPPSDAGTILALGVLALAIHLVVNALGGYGYFRDELYYLACARHLSAGYVDQPPLSILVLAVTRSLLGDSVFAIRLVPALASGLSVIMLGLLIRRMRGPRSAVILASACFLASPLLLGTHTYYSMNSLDVLFWLLAAHALLGLVDDPSLSAWVRLGAILGIGLLNKTSVLWLGAGIGATILLTDLRGQLRRPGPYVAALFALLIFAPYIGWNLLHDSPHLEFLRNATQEKYASLTRSRFLADQFLMMNPFTFLVSLPGLWWCLFNRDGRRHRALGVMFLTVFAVLLANAHTKAEYLGPAYPPLFACGAVAICTLSIRWRRSAVPAIGGLLVASGLVLAPLAMPILPIPDYIRYSRSLGIAPSTPEGKRLSELPQFFADMNGWEGLARDVSAAFESIPPEEQSTTVAFVGNYGEAGALELYASQYPLPRVICSHNSYWLWGVGRTPITTFIRLGGDREDYLEKYGDVTLAGIHYAKYAMPYEDSLSVFIARHRGVPIEQDWPKAKHFE